MIETDYRGIEWTEDCWYPKPDIPKSAVEAYLKALDQYCNQVEGDDLNHYFTIIDGDKVEIIPASQYKEPG